MTDVRLLSNNNNYHDGMIEKFVKIQSSKKLDSRQDLTVSLTFVHTFQPNGNRVMFYGMVQNHHSGQ